MHVARKLAAGCLVAGAALAAGACRASAPAEPVPEAAPASVAAPTVTYDDHGSPVGLHGYNPFTDRVTSGAQPEGEEAFRNLAALGYRTIVSVDGAKPDLELAKRHGLRYVHVPTQYSGVRPEEIAQIAKAIDTSDGPVYVHCHHGKHRSPAALAAACVSLGLLTPEAARAEMETSGTDPKYAGLFRDAEGAAPIGREALDSMSADLPECVSPGDLAAAMVDVDLRWEHLKASKAASWGVPPENPDVDPPHEARMLWEHYREIARLSDAREHGERFAAGLAEATTASEALEAALRAKDAKAAEEAFARGAKSCSSCHAEFRDN